MEKEIDEKCVDMDAIHGSLVKMECMHPWSDAVYANTKSPLTLSGWYKMTFEDGAEVEVASIYAAALAQGSFWFIRDSKNQVPDCVFVREPRALAYFAKMGATLKRDAEGECVLPSSVEEAEQILWGSDGFDVPYEALKAGCATASENMEKWIKDWQQRGLIKWNEGNESWEMTHG